MGAMTHPAWLFRNASPTVYSEAEKLQARLNIGAAAERAVAMREAAVGGAVQSVDLGDATIEKPRVISVILDGLVQRRTSFSVIAGVVSPVGTWPEGSVVEITWGQAGSGTAVIDPGMVIPTLANAHLAVIPLDVDVVTVNRWSGSSRWAPARYARVDVEPSHALKFYNRGWWTIVEQEIYPEFAGAIGNGIVDDTAAFARAELVNRRVRGTPDRFYLLNNFSPVTNTNIDLTGCHVYRVPFAASAINLTQYHGSLNGGDFIGRNQWARTFITADAAQGATTVTVDNATDFRVGMRLCFGSSWEPGVDTRKIAGKAGNVLTLDQPLRGAVTAGFRLVGDFEEVVATGAQFIQGRVTNVWIRSCLHGIRTGLNGGSGTNNFTRLLGIAVSDCLGCGIIDESNSAAETRGDWFVNGGYTQTANYVGDGITQTFGYLYAVTPIVHRWGSGASVRVYVNGVRLTAGTQYTVDPATATVTLAAIPAGGAAVMVVNYEYCCFGTLAEGQVGATSPSSVERIGSGITLSCRVGQLYDNCELGFIDHTQSDGCSYAGVMLRNTRDMYISSFQSLFTPFSVIVDAGCVNTQIGVLATSLAPDNVELTPTVGKCEITIRVGATNTSVGWATWNSKSGYTQAVGTGTLATGGQVTITNRGFAAGGPPSGRFIGYGATTNIFAQIPSEGNALYFGGPGTKYVTAQDDNAVMVLGAIGVNGRFEMHTGGGALLHGRASGRLGILKAAPAFTLDVEGPIGWKPGASVDPVENGQLVVEASSDTAVTFKLKGSDGIVRTHTLALT
jgi:hypothetical protein